MIRARLCLTAALLLLAAPYAALALWLLHTGTLRSLAIYLAALLLQALLCAAIARTWRTLLLVQFPLLVLAAVFAAYTVIYGTRPGNMIAYVLVTSRWEEVRGFIAVWQGGRIVAVAFLYLGGYLLAALGAPGGPLASARTATARYALLATAVVLGGFAATREDEFIDGLAAYPPVGTAFFLAGPVRDTREAISGTHFTHAPYGAHRAGGREVHVFVVGESARRDSWSAYGYSRPTTPYVDAHRAEIVLFSHAMADANNTVFAVPIMLTETGREGYTPSLVHGNIAHLAHEVGYRTVWLSNQDFGVSVLVGMQQADRVVRPNALSGYVNGTLPPDGVLLAPLAEELASTDRPLFIGLHTFGSHWQYESRYPPEFARFGPTAGLSFLSAFAPGGDARVVNAYDNSIAYTDWFLGQIMDRLRRLEVPATLTYVADHGEDLMTLDGRAGHGVATFSRQQYDIPAFVWMNERFRATHPEVAAAVAQNATRLVRSHNVFYSLAELMGIGWPGARPESSFADARFVPDTTSPLIVGGALSTQTP